MPSQTDELQISDVPYANTFGCSFRLMFYYVQCNPLKCDSVARANFQSRPCSLVHRTQEILIQMHAAELNKLLVRIGSAFGLIVPYWTHAHAVFRLPVET